MQAIRNKNRMLLLFFFRALERFRQIFPRFFQRAESIVVSLQSLAVLSNSAFALAGDVEDLSKLDSAPHFCPAGITIAVERSAISIGGGLIIALEIEDLGDAIVRQRTVLVEIQSLVEFSQRARQISLLLHRLATKDGRPQLHIAGVREHVMIRVDRDAPRTSES